MDRRNIHHRRNILLRLKLIAASMFSMAAPIQNRRCNVALYPTPDRIIESMSTGRTNSEYDKLPSWHQRPVVHDLNDTAHQLATTSTTRLPTNGLRKKGCRSWPTMLP